MTNLIHQYANKPKCLIISETLKSVIIYSRNKMISIEGTENKLKKEKEKKTKKHLTKNFCSSSIINNERSV